MSNYWQYPGQGYPPPYGPPSQDWDWSADRPVPPNSNWTSNNFCPPNLLNGYQHYGPSGPLYSGQDYSYGHQSGYSNYTHSWVNGPSQRFPQRGGLPPGRLFPPAPGVILPLPPRPRPLFPPASGVVQSRNRPTSSDNVQIRPASQPSNKSSSSKTGTTSSSTSTTTTTSVSSSSQNKSKETEEEKRIRLKTQLQNNVLQADLDQRGNSNLTQAKAPASATTTAATTSTSTSVPGNQRPSSQSGTSRKRSNREPPTTTTQIQSQPSVNVNVRPSSTSSQSSTSTSTPVATMPVGRQVPCHVMNKERFCIYSKDLPTDVNIDTRLKTIQDGHWRASLGVWHFPNRAYAAVRRELMSIEPPYLLSPNPNGPSQALSVIPLAAAPSPPVPLALRVPPTEPLPTIDMFRGLLPTPTPSTSTSQSLPPVINSSLAAISITTAPAANPSTGFQIPGYLIRYHLIPPCLLKPTVRGVFAKCVKINSPRFNTNAQRPEIVLLRLGLAKNEIPVRDCDHTGNKLLQILKVRINETTHPLPPKAGVHLSITLTPLFFKADGTVISSPIEVEIIAAMQNYSSEFSVYGCLSIVNKLNAKEMLDGLRQKLTIPKERTKKMVAEKIKDDIENGILSNDTNLPVSILLCPLGKTKIKFPCRGNSCKHYACFDAWNFLSTYQNKSDWSCPNCDGPLNFEDLRIDSYFFEILRTIGDRDINVYRVRLNQDGSFAISATQQTQASKPVEIALIEDEDIVTIASSDEEDVPTPALLKQEPSGAGAQPIQNKLVDEDNVICLTSDDDDEDGTATTPSYVPPEPLPTPNANVNVSLSPKAHPSVSSSAVHGFVAAISTYDPSASATPSMPIPTIRTVTPMSIPEPEFVVPTQLERDVNTVVFNPNYDVLSTYTSSIPSTSTSASTSARCFSRSGRASPSLLGSIDDFLEEHCDNSIFASSLPSPAPPIPPVSVAESTGTVQTQSQAQESSAQQQRQRVPPIYIRLNSESQIPPVITGTSTQFVNTSQTMNRQVELRNQMAMAREWLEKEAMQEKEREKEQRIRDPHSPIPNENDIAAMVRNALLSKSGRTAPGAGPGPISQSQREDQNQTNRVEPHSHSQAKNKSQVESLHSRSVATTSENEPLKITISTRHKEPRVSSSSQNDLSSIPRQAHKRVSSTTTSKDRTRRRDGDKYSLRTKEQDSPMPPHEKISSLDVDSRHRKSLRRKSSDESGGKNMVPSNYDRSLSPISSESLYSSSTSAVSREDGEISSGSLASHDPVASTPDATSSETSDSDYEPEPSPTSSREPWNKDVSSNEEEEELEELPKPRRRRTTSVRLILSDDEDDGLDPATMAELEKKYGLARVTIDLRKLKDEEILAATRKSSHVENLNAGAPTPIPSSSSEGSSSPHAKKRRKNPKTLTDKERRRNLEELRRKKGQAKPRRSRRTSSTRNRVSDQHRKKKMLESDSDTESNEEDLVFPRKEVPRKSRKMCELEEDHLYRSKTMQAPSREAKSLMRFN